MPRHRCAILDDYQNVVLTVTDWSKVSGDLDIKAANLALEKSKSEKVRAFASDMVRDHTAVNDKALALVKKLNVTPEDNATSKSLVTQANEKKAELSKLTGAAFDKSIRLANSWAYCLSTSPRGTAAKSASPSELS